MKKLIAILGLLSVFFAGSAKADFLTNVDVGIFEFRLHIRHNGQHVNFAKLGLRFQDFARLNMAIVFDNVTINHIGQKIVFQDTDEDFDQAAAFLTSGLPDWIIVSLATPTRDSNIEATEPNALFGDPTGAAGIDFAGLSIKSIELQVGDLVFIHGYDTASQGAYTNIVVQALVKIDKQPISENQTALPGIPLLLLDE